jgi:hypothetical protein
MVFCPSRINGNADFVVVRPIRDFAVNWSFDIAANPKLVVRDLEDDRVFLLFSK